jgi:hypothetical protein
LRIAAMVGGIIRDGYGGGLNGRATIRA